MGKNVNKERPSFMEGLLPKEPTHTHTPTHTYTPTPQKELKSRRVSLLMKPSTVEKLDVYAKLNETSRNDIIQNLVEEFLAKEN